MRGFISIDPGLNKCGLVLVDLDQGIVIDGRVVKKSEVLKLIIDWEMQFSIEGIVLGNGTGSKYWQKFLINISPIEIVEERGTTLRARDRYWELWPPKGWRRFLPRGLILPPDHLDAIAALILLEDHFQRRFDWMDRPDFRILL